MIVDISIFINYKKKIIINININNFIYAIKKIQLFDKFKAEFKEKFEVKLFGKVRLILNILVKRDIKYKTFYFNYIYYI